MNWKSHSTPIIGGLLVGGLLVTVICVGVSFQVPGSTINTAGLGILLATFALGTYAKLYRVGWREVLFILVANGVGMATRVKLGFPYGLFQVGVWVYLQIFVLFYWAARRKRKRMGGTAPFQPVDPA